MLYPDFYEVTVPAANEPILFAEASAWCRDVSTADQALVESLISSATALLESMTNRVFVTRTFAGKFSYFCQSRYTKLPYVEIRRSPLVSIASVTISGDLVDSEDYLIENSSSFTRILFKNSYNLDSETVYPIEIVFVAGNAVVPRDIVTAIEQTVLFWYENRGDISTYEKMRLPLIAQPIIRKYRIVNSFG